MPAIASVPRAEGAGFYCESLSRAYSVPEGPRCRVAILGVDRGHPGLRMRPDEIEGLTGVFEPNFIHEVRCSIRLERPSGYRKSLQQSSLELQIGIEVRILQCDRGLRSPQLQHGNPAPRDSVRSQ